MVKKLVLFLLVAVLLSFSSITVLAADNPVCFTKTFTVTEDGGRYQVGFATIEFKKEFLTAELLPREFTVKLCARDGHPGIYVEPSTADFAKKVHIRVDSYKGLLYDETTMKNIYVEVRNHQIKAEHFSWLRFR